MVPVSSAPLPAPSAHALAVLVIVAGIVILARRKIDWPRLLLNNTWIVLYLLYCLASMTWSDEPTILMKRWVKDLGNPIMALVILTERRPYEAVGVVLRRLTFLLRPLSCSSNITPSWGEIIMQMVRRCSREWAIRKMIWG